MTEENYEVITAVNETVVSEEERQSIINEAVEKAMLLLPEVVGNLMQEKVAMKRLADNFYKENPSFKEKKGIVGSVLEQYETENPGNSYEEILRKAKPEIKRRINLVSGIDNKNVAKPNNIKFDNTARNISNVNGEL